MAKTEIAFRLADKDKSGYIEKSELDLLTKSLSEEQREVVLKKCDVNGDGKLSYSEFSRMMAMPKKK